MASKEEEVTYLSGKQRWQRRLSWRFNQSMQHPPNQKSDTIFPENLHFSILNPQALSHLDAHKAKWAALPATQRAALLRDCMRRAIDASRAASDAAVRAKGSYGSGCGEEWMNFMPLVFGIKEYADAMDADGQPAPLAVKQRSDGQYVATVRAALRTGRVCSALCMCEVTSTFAFPASSRRAGRWRALVFALYHAHLISVSNGQRTRFGRQRCTVAYHLSTLLQLSPPPAGPLLAETEHHLSTASLRAPARRRSPRVWRACCSPALRGSCGSSPARRPARAGCTGRSERRGRPAAAL